MSSYSNQHANSNSNNKQPKSKYIDVTYEPSIDLNNTNNNSENFNNSDPSSHLINPSLVLFPLNHPNINQLNDSESTKWGMFQNRDKKRKDDKLLLGESTKIIFDSKTKMTKNLSDYVIGIFSKRKREMKFVDIDSIFLMNQKIRRIEEHAVRAEKEREEKEQQMQMNNLIDISNGLNIENSSSNNITNNVSQGANYIDNKLQLIKDFGTTKAKKAASGIKAHMVNENNISSVNAVKRLLEDNAVKQNLDVMMNEEQQYQNKLANWREILPEFDLNTADKRMIFSLESSKKKFQKFTKIAKLQKFNFLQNFKYL